MPVVVNDPNSPHFVDTRVTEKTVADNSVDVTIQAPSDKIAVWGTVAATGGITGFHQTVSEPVLTSGKATAWRLAGSGTPTGPWSLVTTVMCVK